MQRPRVSSWTMTGEQNSQNAKIENISCQMFMVSVSKCCQHSPKLVLHNFLQIYCEEGERDPCDVQVKIIEENDVNVLIFK